jgi:acyl carrier protein
MTQDLKDSIRKVIIDKAAKKARLKKIDDGILEEDFSLTGSGLFDSMDIWDLITDIEGKLDIEVDLSDFEPHEFSTVSGFVDCVMKTQ